jgi:hypothetical protein
MPQTSTAIGPHALYPLGSRHDPRKDKGSDDPFDKLCEAAGQEPRFELAFRVLDAPRLVQWELRQRLDGIAPAPPHSSPRWLLLNLGEGEAP